MGGPPDAVETGAIASDSTTPHRDPSSAASRFNEVSSVFVRFDHVDSRLVNADHSKV